MIRIIRLGFFFLLQLVPCGIIYAKNSQPQERLLSTKVELPLYFWNAENFGDLLSEKIVEKIVGRGVATTYNHLLGKKKLLALGSIIHWAEDRDVIWGSGINGKHPDKTDKEVYRFTNLDVRAVRGPLTRQFLLEMGIYCPEVYGDPALLFPKLFPEWKKQKEPSREFIIIPHVADEPFFENNPYVVSPREDCEEVIKKILDSKFVISSSLHGLIVAEAFGIPARLIRVSNIEPLFKYQDYYYGTGRFDFQFATTVEEALELGGEPLPIIDLEKLYNAFPFEFFPKPYYRQPFSTKAPGFHH